MRSDFKYNVLPEEPCLEQGELFDYIDGKLGNRENHRVEKHLLECEMCSDALEGLSLVENRDSVVFHEGKPKGRIITMHTGWKIAMAASVVLLMGLFFLMNRIEKEGVQIFSEHFTPAKTDTASQLQVSKDTIDKPTIATNSKDERSLVKNTEDKETIIVTQQQLADVVTIEPSPEPAPVPERMENAAPSSDSDEMVLEESSASEREDKNEDIVSGSYPQEKTRDNAKPSAKKRMKSKTSSEASSPAAAAESRTLSKMSFTDSTTSAAYEADKKDAVDKYNTGKYEQASVAFEETLKNSPNDKEALFLQAVSLLGTKEKANARKAITNLDKLIASGDANYKESARWYKSLALVKLNKKKDASRILKEIIGMNGTYKVQAENLLKDL